LACSLAVLSPPRALHSFPTRRSSDLELSALEVFEVGKPWTEADGDIREAIDFCLFYAQQMRLIGRPRLTQQVPGEESYYHYWPRDRKSTRLNSSHLGISYAVFCLKKK